MEGRFEEKNKFTKNCLLPWRYLLIHAGGLMQTCPCPSDVEIGDFIFDHFLEPDGDVLNKKSLRMVREGLLTGNLRPMCRNCAFADPKLITTEEFKDKLIEFLESNIQGYKYDEKDDLTRLYSYDMIGLSLSNRCNLRCLYCNQSTCADTNPFYKAEYPFEYAMDTLEFFISKRKEITLTTSVEGEVTIYPRWYEIYSRLLEKYPDIRLSLTTNLNREYSDEEIELLARHYRLDISCDSLNPEIYSKIRVNGRLDLLKKNVGKIQKKIEELHTKCTITMHVVVCNLTWESIEEVSEYAFTNGMGINIGNYEERANALGYREGILKPVNLMPLEIQEKVAAVLNRVSKRAEELGLIERGLFVCHGDIISRVNKYVRGNFHRFNPRDEQIIYKEYIKADELGTEKRHLDIVYDDDNFSYEGILCYEPCEICIDGIENVEKVVVRLVSVYKEGTSFYRFNRRVHPGYRIIQDVIDGSIKVSVRFESENVECVLAEIIEL